MFSQLASSSDRRKLAPLSDEPARRVGVDIAGEHPPVEIKLPLLPLILSVKVRGAMFPVEHANHDAEKDRDDRHVPPAAGLSR